MRYPLNILYFCPSAIQKTLRTNHQNIASTKSKVQHSKDVLSVPQLNMAWQGAVL